MKFKDYSVYDGIISNSYLERINYKSNDCIDCFGCRQTLYIDDDVIYYNDYHQKIKDLLSKLNIFKFINGIETYKCNKCNLSLDLFTTTKNKGIIFFDKADDRHINNIVKIIEIDPLIEHYIYKCELVPEWVPKIDGNIIKGKIDNSIIMKVIFKFDREYGERLMKLNEARRADQISNR